MSEQQLRGEVQSAITQVTQFKRAFHARIETLEKQMAQVLRDTQGLNESLNELRSLLRPGEDSTSAEETESTKTSAESQPSLASRRAKR